MEEENEDHIKEEIIRQAYIQFTHHFQNYVKEMNPDLWKRAVDYAKTFTEEDVEGIELSYEDEEEE
jgi:hypothetical protein